MRNYINLLLVFLFTTAIACSAQDTTFIYTYGGKGYDQGQCVRHTADGGFALLGSSGSFGNGISDVYLIKTDSAGVFLWSKTYGGSQTDFGFELEQTQDKGYIITGYTNSFNALDYDVYLIRTDSMGDTLWTRTYGSTGWDMGYSVKQLGGGGFIIAGETSATSDLTGTDVFLIRTDAMGDTLWTRSYGGMHDDVGRSIALTHDGGYIIAGGTSSYGNGKMDVFVIKTDSQGDTLWTYVRGGNQDDIANKVIQVADTGYVMLGTHESWGLGGKDLYFLKLDKAGNMVREDSWGTIQDDEGMDIQEMPDGQLASVGFSKGLGFSGTQDIYLVISSSSGFWQAGPSYGSTGDDLGNSVAFTNSGGFAILGTTDSYGQGYTDLYFITTDSVGKDQLGQPIADGTPDSTFLDTNHQLIVNLKSVSGHSGITIQFYPQPLKEMGTLQLNGLESQTKHMNLVIFNGMGQIVSVEESQFSNQIKLNCRGYSPGMYFFQLTIETEQGLEVIPGKFMAMPSQR